MAGKFKRQNKERAIVNEAIRFQQMRVVADKGEQLGIMSKEEALAAAQDRGLDLILLTDKTDPPVCKIIDYGKFLYEKEKQKKEAKKKQKVIHLKEIKIRHKIGAHDLDIKINHIIEFLEHNDKVKVSMMFYGRERAFVDAGKKMMTQIMERIKHVGKVEKGIERTHNALFLLLAPIQKGK
ncbi:translation initiation factor IF-3 [bacterium]